MIHYNFPHIEHISDVRPYIAGKSEFREIEKDWYIVINYMVALEDTFPPMTVSGGDKKMRAQRLHERAILRECRGLIFDSTSGDLISRPYHKFFNVGERPELHVNSINLSDPHVVLEKLDGSMIRPIPLPNNERGFRLGTKAGVTDVSMRAEVWLARHPRYIEFVNRMLDMAIVPIFEWCSRKDRIVVDYPEDRLVLTAMRELRSGIYFPYEGLVSHAQDWGYDIDVVKAINPEQYLSKDYTSDLSKFVDVVKSWEGTEGIVLRFDTGHMAKVKADDYVLLHQSKAAVSQEKYVIKVIADDNIDDLLPLLAEDDQKRLKNFQRAFWSQVDEVASSIVDMYIEGGSDVSDQRQFAQQFVASCPRQMHPFMYGLKKGKGAKRMLVDNILKSVGTQKAVNSGRWMWGGLRWDPYAPV